MLTEEATLWESYGESDVGSMGTKVSG